MSQRLKLSPHFLYLGIEWGHENPSTAEHKHHRLQDIIEIFLRRTLNGTLQIPSMPLRDEQQVIWQSKQIEKCFGHTKLVGTTRRMLNISIGQNTQTN